MSLAQDDSLLAKEMLNTAVTNVTAPFDYATRGSHLHTNQGMPQTYLTDSIAESSMTSVQTQSNNNTLKSSYPLKLRDALTDFMIETYNEPTQGLYYVNMHLKSVGNKLCQIKNQINQCKKNLSTHLTDVMEDSDCIDKILHSQMNFERFNQNKLKQGQIKQNKKYEIKIDNIHLNNDKNNLNKNDMISESCEIANPGKVSLLNVNTLNDNDNDNNNNNSNDNDNDESGFVSFKDKLKNQNKFPSFEESEESILEFQNQKNQKNKKNLKHKNQKYNKKDKNKDNKNQNDNDNLHNNNNEEDEDDDDDENEDHLDHIDKLGYGQLLRISDMLTHCRYLVGVIENHSKK